MDMMLHPSRVNLRHTFDLENPKMKLPRLNLLLLATALTLLVSGCVKVKQAVSVMPDGSGKMVLTLGANQEMQQPGQPDMSEVDLLEMNDESSGFVAFTKPKVTEEAGWKYVSFTAYFDDINKVRLGKEDGEGQPPAKYAFDKDGEGFKLIVTNAMTAQMGKGIAEQPDPDQQQLLMAQMALAGLRIEETYELPGKVAEAPAGGTSEGRVASVVMTDADIFNKEKGKVFAGGDPRTITTAANEVTEEAAAAWKAELTAAKAEWEALKKELEEKKAAEPAVEEIGGRGQMDPAN